MAPTTSGCSGFSPGSMTRVVKTGRQSWSLLGLAFDGWTFLGDSDVVDDNGHPAMQKATGHAHVPERVRCNV